MTDSELIELENMVPYANSVRLKELIVKAVNALRGKTTGRQKSITSGVPCNCYYFPAEIVK